MLCLLQVKLAFDVIQETCRKLVQPVVVFRGLEALAYNSFYELRPRDQFLPSPRKELSQQLTGIDEEVNYCVFVNFIVQEEICQDKGIELLAFPNFHRDKRNFLV